MAPSRQQLSQREIDAVLRHYRVGAVREIRELPEGSAYSPKVVLEAERGTLLLKRRARGLDMPALVGFGHEVLLGCLEHGLCVPPLLATEGDRNSMVQHEDHVYELFVFIEGQRFDPMRRAHASELGFMLSETHRVMDRLRPTFEPVTESRIVDPSRVSMLRTDQSPIPPEIADGFTRILEYGQELAQANASSRAIVHGDWHPGNMIFRGDTLVGICDFDNTRIGSRDRELAQALVHASLVLPRPGETAQQSSPEPARDRLGSFWEGFRANHGLGVARTIAGLMPAVMIDEALASLSSGMGPQHLTLLNAVWRKAHWLDEHQDELIELLSR